MRQPRLRWLAKLTAGLGVAAVLGCGLLAPNADPEQAPESTARALPTFSTELPASSEEQARLALAQDAWRREARFIDAAQPGFLFESTRVLQEEIDDGMWSNEDLYRIGGQLFTLTFTREVGLGAADLPSLSRFHRGQRGGPDAHRCADCHWRGGLAGAGDAADNAFFRGDGETEASTLARNPPSLAGAGWVELLGQQQSRDLQSQRDELVEFTSKAGYPVRQELVAQGISFGFLSVDPDGTVSSAELDGIDADLVIKPFGWKGTFATLREVVEDALLVHHGMQSTFVVAHEDEERTGNGPALDPDGDGVDDEITEGQVTALSLFVAMQEVPVEATPPETDHLLQYARGRLQFDELGCATCHQPSLTVATGVFELVGRDGAATHSVDLGLEAAQPRAETTATTTTLRLYSDLKRHHMGAVLAERRADKGLESDVFITRPLWGIARSRPYLHDARAPTLEDAILLHGGEAQASADAFSELDEPQRAALRVFLTSLTRAQRLVTP